MIETITKPSYVNTHILDVEPSSEKDMYGTTQCGLLFHVGNVDRETVESKDEIRYGCEECLST